MSRALETIYDLRPEIDESPSRRRESFPDVTEEAFWSAYEIAKPYSLIPVAGFYNTYKALEHVSVNRVPGDLVECGTLLGGLGIFMTRLRDVFNLQDRILHVFDTFTGFPTGTTGLRLGVPVTGPQFPSFYEAVVANFERSCGTDHVEFHVGPVEETLSAFGAGPLALARLDTDFYESTRTELETLYPLLSSGGVLIVDDYGVYEGARRATDEYLSGLTSRPLMVRVDTAVRSGVKP